MQLQILKRTRRISFLGAVAVFVSAILLSLFFSGVLLSLGGTPPAAGFTTLFQGGFGSRWALEDSVLKAIPIFLCSLGVAVAFRLKVWNIGAEGQYALGAIGATGAALAFPDWPSWAVLPMMALSAACAGGIWGLIPALLRQKMHTNEIIVTLMFNYIAVYLLQYLVLGVWRDPNSHGFAVSATFSDAAIIGPLSDATSVHWGLVHCLVLGILLLLFFRYTRIGYEIKAAGENMNAARYAGIRVDFLVCLVMAISGGLAGWAGFVEVSATVNQLQPAMLVGYGYTAIVVAWLARLNPLGIAVASFLLAGLRVGVESLQLDLQVPADFGDILEGSILLMVLAAGLFLEYRIVRKGRT